jgi:AcrR family transcriptional regulator
MPDVTTEAITPGVRRVGRPPATDPATTRRAILDAARLLFARRGFASTTNRLVAAQAGLTAGAVHHHFGSKLDLYVAVHDDVQDRVYRQFAEAVAGVRGLRNQLRAVFETAHVMNRSDPTLAQFVGAVRIDARRHPEMREALVGLVRQRDRFYADLVDHGVDTGEVDPSDRAMVHTLVITLMIGLTDAVSSDLTRHRQAIDAIGRLLDGGLLRPMSG